MLLSELNVGDKIKLNISSFNSSYLGSSIIFKIADKNHSGYPGDSITLITDKVIKFMCFDAKESKNSDSNRQSYGNNRYSVSNVLQWLNSNAAAGEWYSAQHTSDAAPTTANVMNAKNAYDGIPGFLKILDIVFERAIIETSQTVILNTITDGGGYETVNSKVFLASATEVGKDNSTDIEEGSLLAMFSDDDSRIAYPTETSINNNESNTSSSTTETCAWWLRTPRVDDSYNLNYVQKPNTISLSNAYYGGLGVRPLCNVYPTLLLSDTIDEDGCYVFNGISSPPKPALISVPELISGKTATITWSKPAEYPITYILERKIGADGEFEQIYSGIERSYTDNILPEYKVLAYRVRSTIADGGAASAYTTSADITVISSETSPEAPVFQTMSESVSAGDNIIVAWLTVTGADSYDLQRSVDGGEYTDISAGTTNTLYIDAADPSWTTVQYRVRGVNDSGNSDWTESVLISVHQSVSTISAPESITVPELNSGASASVAWSAVQNASGYILERSADNSSFTEVYRGSETVYADTILSSWNTVQYRVCAYDGDGNTSEYTTSGVVSVNKTNADLLTAIRNHAEQDIKIIFDDGTVIDKSKISVSSGGLTLTEVLNGETDMTVGRAVSSLVEMVLFNTDGEFQDFNFNQEFTLQIGVKINDNFEYITLGIFKGERPEKVRGKLINFSAYDRMVYFDISAEDFITGLTFPTTLGEIYQKLCSFVGVNPVSLTFINSDKQFTFNPFSSADYTAREILAWIAEAAGAYARFNPSGNVELTWFTNKSHTILRTDRFEMSESEFTTPAIDKLEVYNSYGDQLVTSGTGSNTYVISDNPFLYIENDTEIEGLQPFVNLIYNRLITFPAYNPVSLRAEWYPEIKCGDIISVVDDYGNTINFPVFSQTITWKGFGKVEYENTGGLTREIAPIQQRELEEIKKKMLRGTDLYTTVESYLNSQEGKASIVSAVGGEFVQISDGSSLTTTNAIEQLVQATETGIENKISLTAGIGNGTIGSKVQAMLTLFANTDSSSISLAANALTLTATPKTVTETYDAGEFKSLIPDLISGVTIYPFELTSDGYRTSTNAGIDSSFSYGILKFDFLEETTVTLSCISYGESNFDYGIVSNLDSQLSINNSADSTNVLKSYKGLSSASADTITLTVPSGSHFITFKYIKDTSGHSNGDYFKIKCTATRQVQGRDNVLSLSSKGIVLSSANLNLSGTVTFSDLETAGATVINGANITTDTLKVKNIFFNSAEEENILSSIYKDSYKTIDFGIMVHSATSDVNRINIYGNEINFCYVGTDDDVYKALTVNTRNAEILFSDTHFIIGNSTNYLNRIYVNRVYFPDGTWIGTAP